jgi:hypothetical protein
MADIQQMVDNARFYNEDGSEVYEDAGHILVRVRTVWSAQVL